MSDRKIQAQAEVGGILRGGYYKDGIFCYHAGTVYIETRDFMELKLLDDKHKVC